MFCFLAEALKDILLLRKLPKEDTEQRKEVQFCIISRVVMVRLLGGILLLILIVSGLADAMAIFMNRWDSPKEKMDIFSSLS